MGGAAVDRAVDVLNDGAVRVEGVGGRRVCRGQVGGVFAGVPVRVVVVGRARVLGVDLDRRRVVRRLDVVGVVGRPVLDRVQAVVGVVGRCGDGHVGVVGRDRLDGAAVDRVLDVLDAGAVRVEGVGGRRVGRGQVDGVGAVVPEPVVVVGRARVLGVDLDRRRVVRRLDVVGVVGRPVLDRVQAVVGVVGRCGDGHVGVVGRDRLDGAAVDRVLDVLDAGAVRVEGVGGRRVGRGQVDGVGAVVPEPVVVVGRARVLGVDLDRRRVVRRLDVVGVVGRPVLDRVQAVVGVVGRGRGGDEGGVGSDRLGGAAVDRVLDVLDAGAVRVEGVGGRRVGRGQVDGVGAVVPEPVVVVGRARVLGVDPDRRRVVRRLDVVGVVGRPVLDRVQAVVGVVGRGRDGDVGVVGRDRLDGAAVDRVLDVLGAGAVRVEGVGRRRVGRGQVDGVGAVVPEPVVVVGRARVLGVDLDRRRVVRRLDVVGVVGRPVLDRVQAVVGVVGRCGDGHVGVVGRDRLDGAAVDRVLDVLDAGRSEERRVGKERGGRCQADGVGAVVPEPVVVGGRARLLGVGRAGV